MKPLIASVSLVVGLLIGFYIGCKHDENYAQRFMIKCQQEFIRVIDNSYADHAAEDSRVVGLIESGDRSNAVRILSRPIADYYQQYAVYGATDKARKLRALIEQLASTNQVVADAIGKKQMITQGMPSVLPQTENENYGR
jgi:hypothetical protein